VAEIQISVLVASDWNFYLCHCVTGCVVWTTVGRRYSEVLGDI